MSSYLVAFLVSEFIPIPDDPTLSHVEFAIWARADARNLTTLVFYISILAGFSLLKNKKKGLGFRGFNLQKS